MADFRSQHLSDWWPWPLSLELVRNVSRGTDNLPVSFGVFCDFSLSSYGQTCIWLTTWPILWPLTSRTAHVGDADNRRILHQSILTDRYRYQAWNSSVFSFGRHGIFSVSINRRNGVTGQVRPLFLGFFILPANSQLATPFHSRIMDITDRRTDWQTDRRLPSTLNAPTPWGRGIKRHAITTLRPKVSSFSLCRRQNLFGNDLSVAVKNDWSTGKTRLKEICCCTCQLVHRTLPTPQFTSLTRFSLSYLARLWFLHLY